MEKTFSNIIWRSMNGHDNIFLIFRKRLQVEFACSIVVDHCGATVADDADTPVLGEPRFRATSPAPLLVPAPLQPRSAKVSASSSAHRGYWPWAGLPMGLGAPPPLVRWTYGVPHPPARG